MFYTVYMIIKFTLTATSNYIQFYTLLTLKLLVIRKATKIKLHLIHYSVRYESFFLSFSSNVGSLGSYYTHKYPSSTVQFKIIILSTIYKPNLP